VQPHHTTCVLTPGVNGESGSDRLKLQRFERRTCAPNVQPIAVATRSERHIRVRLSRLQICAC
jgi:hypothetical protein